MRRLTFSMVLLLAMAMPNFVAAGPPSFLPIEMTDTSFADDPTGNRMEAGRFPSGPSANQLRVEYWSFVQETWTELPLLEENGSGENGVMIWSEIEGAFLLLNFKSDSTWARKLDPASGEVPNGGDWPRITPDVHQGAAIIQTPQAIYLLGGFGGENVFSNCSTFSLVTLQWEEMESLPGGRFYGAGLLDSTGALWYAGGCDATNYTVAQVWKMPAGKGVWEAQPDLVVPREFFVLKEYNGEILAAAGMYVFPPEKGKGCGKDLPKDLFGRPGPPSAEWIGLGSTEIVTTQEILDATLANPRWAHFGIVDFSPDEIIVCGGEKLYEEEGRTGPCGVDEALPLPALKNRWLPPKGLSSLAVEKMAKEKKVGWQWRHTWVVPVTGVRAQVLGEIVSLDGGTNGDGQAVANSQYWNRDDPQTPATGPLGIGLLIAAFSAAFIWIRRR